jgi:hypothetical protein
MELFFKLEGAYLVIALFILAVTVFITTREFMPKGSLKKGLIYVGSFLALAIFSHFMVTKNRIDSVIEAFNNNQPIICENRIYTKSGISVEVKRDKGWELNGLNFKSPQYSREFFTARCFPK